MTPHEASLILRRMYRQLRSGEVKTVIDRKMPDCGKIDYPDGLLAEIRLNPDIRSAGGIVSTLLHELLHLIFYGRKESEILGLEKELYQALSDKQLTNLIRKAVWWIGR